MAVSTREAVAPRGRPAPVLPGRSGWRHHPMLLVTALVLACVLAAFAEGATAVAPGSRLTLGVVAIALGATASWAAAGGICRPGGRLASVGLALLVALAGWTALSLLWSVAPDRTWLEANRLLAYALVVGLALALGASDARAITWAALGLLGGVTLVAAYAVATKTLPGVSLGGLLELDRPGAPARLGAPLGSPNALALLCALAVPIALRVSCDRAAERRGRALALAAALLLVVTIGLAASRAGFAAVAVGALVLTALGGARGRGLAALAGIVAASVPVLVVAFSLPGTSEAGAPLAARQDDGLLLLVTFLGALLLLGLAALAFGRLERSVPWTAARTRRVLGGLGGVAGLAVIVAVAVVAASDRGLGGTVADGRDAFTAAPARDAEDVPDRLATLTSDTRWARWQEAAGAWSDRSAAGWGGGSFGVLHLRYRDDARPATQVRSGPLQLLAETGIVGLVLFVGAVGALLAAALARVRGLPGGRERDLAVAALAAVTAWVVHGLTDPDWTIPGVTLPALVLLGVLAGRPAAASRDAWAREGGAGRALAATGVALVLCVVAASAGLPAWADGKATNAVRSAGDPAALATASADAKLAARLDPVAVRPLLAGAAVARRQARLLESRTLLLDAVGRQPESAAAWRALALAGFALADRAGYERAALRALGLDPRSPAALRLAQDAAAYRAPAGASATAVGTPLTPAPVQAAPAAPAGVTGPTGATGATGATGP